MSAVLSHLVVSDSCDPVDFSHQAPLSMESFKQEYWSRLPFPSPRESSDPGIEPAPPALAGGFFIMGPPGKPPHIMPARNQERRLGA